MSDKNVTPNTATSSRDRLEEICARLDALNAGDSETCRIADFYGLADPVSEACPRCEVHRHAEHDLAYMLAELDARDERIALLRAEVADLEGLRG